MTEQHKKESEFDIFIANSIYPQAEQIFSFHPKTLDEIKKDCYVVVDTNALLVPYNTGKDSLQQIDHTYRQLVTENRLIIPGQVAREFAKNRAEKIGQLFQQISNNASQNFLPLGNYPLLESLDQYQEAKRLAKEIASLQGTYKKMVAGLLDHIREWMWNDPITVLFSELFASGAVLDEPIDTEEMRRDLLRRQLHHIPPGYKDGAKEDLGIGDLLIWHTILHVGEKYKMSVLFVSGDEKPDWWTRGANQALYPRFELVSEFARYSDGATFRIIKFSDLLELYGATESVVEEVRHEEIGIQANKSRPSDFYTSIFGQLSKPAIIAKHGVTLWLRMEYPASEFQINPTGSPDMWVINDDGSRYAVEIYYRSDPSQLQEIPGLAFLEQNNWKQSGASELIIIIVVPQENLFAMMDRFRSLISDIPNTEIVIGYVDDTLVFQEASLSSKLRKK